jgi:hypothetical protein
MSSSKGLSGQILHHDVGRAVGLEEGRDLDHAVARRAVGRQKLEGLGFPGEAGEAIGERFRSGRIGGKDRSAFAKTELSREAFLDREDLIDGIDGAIGDAEPAAADDSSIR